MCNRLRLNEVNGIEFVCKNLYNQVVIVWCVFDNTGGHKNGVS